MLIFPHFSNERRMISMSTKQKIFLHKYRDDYSKRRIAKELRINRGTVRRSPAAYRKAREKSGKP